MPLPLGWETAQSRSTGLVYYVNTKTGATQYEFPEVSHALQQHIKERQAFLL